MRLVVGFARTGSAVQSDVGSELITSSSSQHSLDWATNMKVTVQYLLKGEATNGKGISS